MHLYSVLALNELRSLNGNPHPLQIIFFKQNLNPWTADLYHRPDRFFGNFIHFLKYITFYFPYLFLSFFSKLSKRLNVFMFKKFEFFHCNNKLAIKCWFFFILFMVISPTCLNPRKMNKIYTRFWKKNRTFNMD